MTKKEIDKRADSLRITYEDNVKSLWDGVYEVKESSDKDAKTYIAICCSGDIVEIQNNDYYIKVVYYENVFWCLVATPESTFIIEKRRGNYKLKAKLSGFFKIADKMHSVYVNPASIRVKTLVSRYNSYDKNEIGQYGGALTLEKLKEVSCDTINKEDESKDGLRRYIVYDSEKDTVLYDTEIALDGDISHGFGMTSHWVAPIVDGKIRQRVVLNTIYQIESYLRIKGSEEAFRYKVHKSMQKGWL